MHTRHGLHHEMLRVGGVGLKSKSCCSHQPFPISAHFGFRSGSVPSSSTQVTLQFLSSSIRVPSLLLSSSILAPVQFHFHSGSVGRAEQGQMVIFQRVGHASSSSSCVTQGPPVPAVGVQQVDCSVLCLGSMRACSSIRFPLLLIPNLWIP